MNDTKRGEDVLGTRYMRTDLGDGVEVMVLLADDAPLVTVPGLTKLVEMAAGLALEALRTSALPRGANW